MPTTISIWAARRPCATSAIFGDKSLSIVSWILSSDTDPCTCRWSVASRWCAVRSSTRSCRSSANWVSFTLLVTSAVAPIPAAWMEIPRLRVTVSVDGLPEHHDIRRKPATYERILKNIAGREVNIHLTITRPMVHSAG